MQFWRISLGIRNALNLYGILGYLNIIRWNWIVKLDLEYLIIATNNSILTRTKQSRIWNY